MRLRPEKKDDPLQVQKAINLIDELVQLNPVVDEFGGIDPPAELPERREINVNGREEHEELLKDHEKMISLGLDPYYETIVYLKRWGGWLNNEDKNNSTKS